MLAKLIEEYKIVNSVGNHVGKIKDIYIDLNNWMIIGFEVTPGPLKKDIMLMVEDIVKFDETDRIIIVNDEFNSEEVPDQPMKERYPFEELRKHNVLDSEGKKVGKIYNLEIPFEKLKTFKVWKVLVRTGISERRLRFNPDEIIEIMDDVTLAKKEEDYQGTE